ncbi:MAG: hypothetical protein MJ157_03510 [Clostridia bacterium]|nr:hypothetical protein [Clostridia bacterium]
MEGTNPVFATSDPHWTSNLAAFQALVKKAEAGDREALEQFALPVEFGEGFYAFKEYCQKQDLSQVQYLKGHLSGSLTISFFVKDQTGNLAYQSPVLRELLVKALGLNGRWQAEVLGELGKKVLIFADEPALGMLASSSLEVKRADLVADLNEICRLIQGAGAVLGIHSCDAMDWTILMESQIEVLNLDAYRFGLTLFPCLEKLKQFLERGGWVAWGIIPTSEEAWAETADSLWYKLNILWDELAEKGLDKNWLRERSFITPACGVGLLKPELAEHIYQVAGQIAQKLGQAF